MDFNREEAVRAKEIAEDLMEKRDFTAARRIALRAQKLCTDLENISQMLMVCDVHCAAEIKVAGNEMDWYAILQIDGKADDVTIKKQYRKFALLLHPDKNKFHGAESAFKLIGEAQRTLLDRGKRSLHDMKRKAFVRTPAQASSYHPQQAPHHATYTSAGHCNVKNRFAGWNPQNHHPQHRAQAQAGVSRDGPTFLAPCPFCFMACQYNREAIKSLVNCKNCGKMFTALETNAQTAFPFTQPGTDNSTKRSYPMKGCKDNSDTKNVGARQAGEKRKRKKAVDSSESSSESSSDSEDDLVTDEGEEIEGGKGFESFVGRQPRRSVRNKRHVSYDENLSDSDEFVNLAEQSMGNGVANSEEASDIRKQPDIASDSEETAPNGTMRKEKMNREEKDESDGCKRNCEVHDLVTESSSEDCSSPSDVDSDGIEVPETEFYNFDDSKSMENFKCGQIWSIYCEEDGLPKYYGRVQKVDMKPEFRVHFNWLEPFPLPDNVKRWRDKKMPICIGTFKVKKGKSETYSSTNFFSHEMKLESGMRKNEYSIHPRVGDAWALYKNWSTELKCSELDNCEYDVVEVSDVNDDHFEVVVLEREAGFNSVFKAATKEGLPMKWRIRREDLLRFSHQMPAYRLSEERDGCLRGFLELDSAALPVKYFMH